MSREAGAAEEHERRETEQERLDRKWGDILQELRVMQTGVQLLAGFLLTLPFTSVFTDLDTFQVVLYLALVVTAAMITLAVVAPVSVHRHLTGRQVKSRVVAAGDVALFVAVTGVAVLVVGMMTFIFDVVVGHLAALVVATTGALVAITLLALVPRLLGRRR